MALFHNWTTENFTHTWNSSPFTFRAGEVYRQFLIGDQGANIELSENLARHFAKHLAMRELNRKGGDLPFSMESIENSPEYLKCLGEGETKVEAPKEEKEPEIVAPVVPVEPVIPPVAPAPKPDAPVEAKKKPGRPKKEEKFEGV